MARKEVNRSHFSIAEELDGFVCKREADRDHSCTYTKGKAEFELEIPNREQVDGESVAASLKTYSIVLHFDIVNDYYIGVSHIGRIGIRQLERDAPLFLVNPATGKLRRWVSKFNSPTGRN